MRDLLLQKYNEQVGPVDEKAAYLTLEWAEYATAWEHLDYTVGSSWGGWAGSRVGPRRRLDRVRDRLPAVRRRVRPGACSSSSSTTCARPTRPASCRRRSAAGARSPSRSRRTTSAGRSASSRPASAITDRDGNPSPPPLGHPGHAAAAAGRAGAVRRLEHRLLPRPAPRSSSTPGRRGARGRSLDARTGGLSTLVVADTTDVDARALRRFVGRRRQPRAHRRRARPAAAARRTSRRTRSSRRTVLRRLQRPRPQRTRGRRASTSARGRCSTRSGSAIRC